MTRLGITGVDMESASPLSRVKWSVIVPWVVTVVLFGAQGYHRFLSGEQARERDAKAIEALSSEVRTLSRQVDRLTVIVERVEEAQRVNNYRRTTRP